MSWRSKTYEVLPALSVRGPVLRQWLRIITIAWMYGIVWMVAVSGNQVKSYARMLGFGEFAFGLLGAVPFVATLGQLIAAVLVERTGLRKYQFVQCGTLHRLLWLPIAAIPFLMPVPSDLAVVAMLVVLALSGFFNALATPAWLTWMGDLIPRRIRGRYFANRGLVAQAVSVFVVVGISIVLDAVTVRGAPETAASQPMLMWTISAVFAVAAVFGAIDILLFRRIREIQPTRKPHRQPAFELNVPRPKSPNLLNMPRYYAACTRQITRELLIEPMREKPFRNYVGYGAALSFSVTLGGWYYWLNATEFLHFSKLGANVLFLVVGPIAGIIAGRVSGRLLDRWGHRPMLILGTAGTMLSAVPWLFANPHTPSPAWVAGSVNSAVGRLGSLFGQGHWRLIPEGAPVGAYLLAALSCVIGGMCWNAVNLAQTNVVLSFSDGQGRTRHVAASAVLTSLGGIVGGILAGTLMRTIQWVQQATNHGELYYFGPFIWNKWHLSFVLSALSRVPGIILLMRMPDVNGGGVRDVIRYVGSNVYNSLAPRIFFPLRVFGWGRRKDNRR